jgi:RNA polymerase sigma-70 factor (ECF subfamily)
MTGAAEIFELHRPRLFGVAYRMLGTRPDAEDILQDTYLRWHQISTRKIKSPVAFLMTVTTRLCLDRLRSIKLDRGQFLDSCLPTPTVDVFNPSPETKCEFTDEVANALFAVLERLSPDERAAFLLHDIFDYDYDEVAQTIGKSEPACRQIIHRARLRVRESGPRFVVAAESRARLLEQFLAAAGSGDRKAVMALIAEQAAISRPGQAWTNAIN